MISYITYIQQFSTINKIKNLKPDRNVKLTGIVKTGTQIGTPFHLRYCGGPFYLEDNTGYVQLNIVGDDGIIKRNLDSVYLNKNVEVIGEYKVPLCQALCICEPNILIENIKILG